MTAARTRRLGLAALALLSYVPLLLAAPGQISADTKAYLYTDPGRLISRAGWLWDPNVAAGTVTHQTIGYLFPMGPYYWVFDQLGVPDWVAQRLWLGTILFAAGTGTAWLLRRLGVRELGAYSAAVVYLASPYILPYFGRTSVLLLPWAALPWLTGLLVLSLRQRGWRAPVLFGIVLTLVGGTNASSLIFVAIGPALWLPFALWVWREVTVRDALTAIGRLAVTCIPSQLWWIAGLRMQGRYGLPILELTESVETVGQTSTAAEVGRGMGYWYAYGRDNLSPWTPAAVDHTQRLWLIATSFALPALAVLSAIFVRWRYRAYFVAAAALGLVVGVGTYPYGDPPLFGWAIKTAADRWAAALALRNTPRAVPLLVLAMATLLGVGADALARSPFVLRGRSIGRTLGRPVAAGVMALALLNMPPLFDGGFISRDLRFPEDIPQYWHDAAATLDARDDGTRVLELPGSDFGVYRWGETQDPITPGLIDRPWIGRELTAYGTPGTVDLLRALDRRLQEGVFDARSVAPIAQLFAAGDLLWRSDTQYERYRGPRPRPMWDAISRADGLGTPLAFGEGVPNVPDERRPMRDEAELGTPADFEDPPALAVFPVDDARAIVRVQPSGDELVVAGDGEALVDAAEAGLLDAPRTILYSASFANDPDALVARLESGADLLLTDGNRRRAQRWGTVKENNGFTEQAGAEPLEDDPKDTRLALFPDTNDDTRTVADYRGIADVEASAYGNIVAYSVEGRPVLALDGDLRTAWSVGGFADVIGERIRITLDEPVTTDAITVVQLQGNRFITRLGVRLDGQRVATIDLTDESFTDAGQLLGFGEPRTFRELELEIVDANLKDLPNYLGVSNVGFREIGIPGVQVEEIIRLPRDLMAAAADTLHAHDLTVLMSRWRADPAEPWRSDPEQRLLRAFELPDGRVFALRGDARIESRADGSTIDAAIGRPGVADGYAEASGTDTLGGSIASRPSSAIDGDVSTAWSPNFGPQHGRSFRVTLPSAQTFDRLDLVVGADGWHSVPTQLTLELDEGDHVVVDLPPVADAPERGATTGVTVSLPRSVTTSGFVVRVTGVREVTTTEYFSGGPIPMPVAIAELGIPGVQAGPLPDRLPATCRADLVEIDGQAVPVRVTGTVADALARRPLTVEPCDGDIELGQGEHVVRTANGIDLGIAIDRVVLDSPAPRPGASAGSLPAITVDQTGRLSYDVEVTDATEPFWLVLGQSHSDGWEAKVDGADLGVATLVDGHANGWLIDPAEHGSAFSVSLQWTPQRMVWAAVVVSGIALAALVVAAAVLWRRNPDALRVPAAAEDAPSLTPVPWQAPATEPSAPSRQRRLPDVLVTGLVAGLVAWVFGGFVVGLAIAAIAIASQLGPRLRFLSLLAIVSLYPATAAWYIAKQARNHFPPGVEWPALMGWTHKGVLIAVLGLAALVAADARRGRRTRDRAGEAAAWATPDAAPPSAAAHR